MQGLENGKYCASLFYRSWGTTMNSSQGKFRSGWKFKYKKFSTLEEITFHKKISRITWANWKNSPPQPFDYVKSNHEDSNTGTESIEYYLFVTKENDQALSTEEMRELHELLDVFDTFREDETQNFKEVPMNQQQLEELINKRVLERMTQVREEADPRKTQFEPMGDETSIEMSPEAQKIMSFMMKKRFPTKVYSDLIRLLQNYIKQPKTRPEVDDFFKV